MGGNVSGLGEASDTDTITHDGAFVQLQQSQIVPEDVAIVVYQKFSKFHF